MMSSITNAIILARFQLETGLPILMLIKAKGNDSTIYRGPTDLGSIEEFLEQNTGRTQYVEKVEKHFV